MQSFAVCNSELTDHIEKIFYKDTQIDKHIISQFSNTSISGKIRELVPLQDLRSDGVFFTGDEISRNASMLLENIYSDSRIIDPACGAGNLLVAVIPSLPVEASLSETLQQWGIMLYGFDLHEEFIEATKLRIILEATKLVQNIDIYDIDLLKSYLPNIIVGNFLDHVSDLEKISHIIINPPYTKTSITGKNNWGTGSVNSAAVFMDLCLQYIQDDSQIVAILPEVLRSGSRYQKWRASIAEHSVGINISQRKRFDAKTDVDIFLLSLRKKAGSMCFWPTSLLDQYSRLADFFDVSVGPVVPHRDSLDGPVLPFLKAKNAPRWEKINSDNITEFRRYSGRTIQPPFVAIRRTSSPSDRERAAATIIEGSKPIAIENHLIIAKPKNGHVDDCKILMTTLKDNNTNDFLNERIRCRHLTVSAVKDIPFIRGCNE